MASSSSGSCRPFREELERVRAFGLRAMISAVATISLLPKSSGSSRHRVRPPFDYPALGLDPGVAGSHRGMDLNQRPSGYEPTMYRHGTQRHPMKTVG